MSFAARGGVSRMSVLQAFRISFPRNPSVQRHNHENTRTEKKHSHQQQCPRPGNLYTTNEKTST